MPELDKSRHRHFLKVMGWPCDPRHRVGATPVDPTEAPQSASVRIVGRYNWAPRHERLRTSVKGMVAQQLNARSTQDAF